MSEARAVAVTGAAGFIGSHTAAALAAACVPLRIHAGPESETRRPAGLSAEFWLDADITDADALEALFRGVATVVHAAGPPSVAESLQNPFEYMRVHALGTTAVLDACVRGGVRRFVYISSAEVYGNQTPPCVPETQPLVASSPYGAAKIGAEQMVRAFAIAGKVEAFVLRPFSIYGPGMSRSGVVAQFLDQATRRATVHVRDPRPVRDFCFVSDVAEAVVAACSVPIDGFAVANLGSGVATSIGDLARLAAELTDAPGIQEAGEKRPASCEVGRLIANTVQARELLGWTASTSLRDGLKKTLEWMPAQ
jgi:nucleoside-diphosphate-sugar epimerase